MLDNLVNKERFEVNTAVDVQRLHNRIVKDPNPRALPSMWILSKKYGAPLSFIKTTYEYHDYTKALTFLDAPLPTMAHRGEKFNHFDHLDPQSYAESPVSESSPLSSPPSLSDKVVRKRREESNERSYPAENLRKRNWGMYGMMSTTQRDRLCVEAVTMIVLFDFMAAHAEAGETGADELIKLCQDSERELKNTVEGGFYRVMRLNFKQVGEVIGMHGGNVAKIRQGNTSVELYHNNTFVISAHSEKAVEEAVKKISCTIYPESGKSESPAQKLTELHKDGKK